MTQTLADPVSLKADFVRDQWQRPLIIPSDGGKPRPYTRSSSAAKVIEDVYNLEMWARRNVAFGMARDKSLVARVLALGGDPSTWNMEVKKACNRIVEQASDTALAHRAADIGTAVHRMTELLDRGQPVEAGPYEGDLEAYANALVEARFTVVDVECRLVCDELEMAGTADRILRNGNRFVVADIKTGESTDYGGLGWAAQLAAYAHSQFYDPDTGERTPLPAVDQTTGIIIHLPAGKGECTLYEIDLVAGYRAAQLANEIRSVRRASRRWIQPLDGGSGEAASASAESASSAGADDRRVTLRERFNRLPDHHRAAFRERDIDPDDLDAIAKVLDQLEPHPVDPDVLATAVDVAMLNTRLLKVTPEHKAWLDTVARQAVAGPGSISFRYEPFERNIHICSALLAFCEATAAGDGFDLRDLIEAVIGQPLAPTITTGAALGALTIDEAIRLDEMATAAISQDQDQEKE